MADRLSISLVIYFPEQSLLEKTLETLYLAAEKAKGERLIDSFFLTIVDNSINTERQTESRYSFDEQHLHKIWQTRYQVLRPEKNLGYGSGHNLAIKSRCDNFHLIVNPDVIVDPDAFIECIRYLQLHPSVGVATPLCHSPTGQQEFLNKSYPSVFVLLLRGFAPQFIKNYFKRFIQAYELSDQPNTPRNDIKIASGCFMFFRKLALVASEGFCEDFFLYFEDFDLSMRLLTNWQIAFVPKAKIIHFGGKSAKKGFKHIVMFIRSAGLFFSRHGWRFW